MKCLTNRELTVKYRDEIEVDNKAEVAKGLCDPKDVVKKQKSDDCDICGEMGVKYLVPGGSMKALLVGDELTGDYFTDDIFHEFEVVFKYLVDMISLDMVNLCPSFCNNEVDWHI